VVVKAADMIGRVWWKKLSKTHFTRDHGGMNAMVLFAETMVFQLSLSTSQIMGLERYVYP